MGKIDYRIFVPSSENNSIKFCTNGSFEIHIDKVTSVTIHLIDDKVIYWLYFKISMDDMGYKLLLRKGSKPKAVLLIGNNSYEIYGDAEVIETSNHNWEQKIEIKLLYTVPNASHTVDNPRKEIKSDDVERFEMMDL